MELDYNKEHWDKACEAVKCKATAMGLKFVSVPAVLGDDREGSDVAPKNGKYTNAIVLYEANGHVWLYSEEGVPVQVGDSADNIYFDDLIGRPKYKGRMMTSETDIPEVSVYTAGTNIQISSDNVISATDTTYSAFTGATTQDAGTAGLVPAPMAGDDTKFLSGNGLWTTVSQYNLPIASANDLGGIKVGTNLSIDSSTGVLSATDTTYSAGAGLDLTGTTFSVDSTTIPTKTEMNAALGEKQDLLTAGDNITITDESGALVISAEGGGITELTAADYNYPEGGTPTSVALWKLQPGVYEWESGTQVRAYVTDDSYLYSGFAIIGSANNGAVPICRGSANGKMFTGDVYATTGNVDHGGDVITTESVKQTTGTSTTGVMSQNAVTSMVFADPSTKNNVRIGSTQTVQNRSTTVGYNAQGYGQYSTAVGEGARQYGNYGVSIGAESDMATTQYAGTVALGAYSGRNITASGMMDISSSDTSYGYNSSKYRLLTGLYDGQSAHDAATVGQLSAAILNGGTTAPTTATAGAVGTQYTYVDTTGTPTAHLCVCTEIDTTDPNNPVYTWQTLV